MLLEHTLLAVTALRPTDHSRPLFIYLTQFTIFWDKVLCSWRIVQKSNKVYWKINNRRQEGNQQHH